MYTSNVDIKLRAIPVKAIWIIFVICAAVVAGTSNNIFSYAALILSVAAIVLLKEDGALCLMMFIMPFANIFKSAPDAQSFFTYLLLFYVLYSLFRRPQIRAKYLVALLCTCVFLLLQMFGEMNIFRAIKFVANLLFVYIAVGTKTQDDNKRVWLFYILGIVISSLIAMLNIAPNVFDYIVEQDLGYEYNYLMRFSGMYADPNYYAVNLIIALCLVVVLNHKKQINAVLAIGLAVLLIAFAIMTYSRSAFLMLLLPLFALIYSKIKNRKKRAITILIVGFIVFAINFLAGRIGFLDVILSRLAETEDASSLTTGRSDLWLIYARYLWNAPIKLLFGSGVGADLVGNRAAHNTYLDVLYYLGIAGAVLLCIAFVQINKVKENPGKKQFLNYSVGLCVLMMYFFLSELFYFDWAIHVAIAFLVSKTDFSSHTDG